LRGVSGASYALQAGIAYSTQDRTQISGNNIFSQNNWTHIVLAFSSATRLFSLYKDGVLQTFSAAAGGAGTGTLLPDSARTLVIGNRTNGDRTWDGRLDDYRVFNQAINSTDVAYLYNSGNGRGRLAFAPSRRRRSRSGGGVL